MAAVAPNPRVEAPSGRTAVRTRRQARHGRRLRVAPGVAWIAVIAVLLGGIVFMNVAVLRLNIRLDRVGRDRAQLRSDVAQLSSDLSSAQAAARIQAQARGLGLVQARAAETSYLDLRP